MMRSQPFVYLRGLMTRQPKVCVRYSIPDTASFPLNLLLSIQKFISLTVLDTFCSTFRPAETFLRRMKQQLSIEKVEAMNKVLVVPFILRGRISIDLEFKLTLDIFMKLLVHL